jgi:tetratricopeptide (TPR) repeat protein
MRFLSRLAFYSLTLLWSFWVAPPAMAQRPVNVTAGELALLPEYCPDTQGFKYGDAYANTSPRAAYWVGLMGLTFWHHHHYCWALVKKHRAMQAGLTDQQRKGLLGNAVSDLEYVVRHATPNFPLLPEVHYRMGEYELLLDNPAAAKEAFEAAIQIKPTYWPAYVMWAEALDRLKLRREALLYLERGLRHTPNEPAMREAYQRMGGNPEAFAASLQAARPAPAASESDAVRRD